MLICVSCKKVIKKDDLTIKTRKKRFGILDQIAEPEVEIHYDCYVNDNESGFFKKWK